MKSLPIEISRAPRGALDKRIFAIICFGQDCRLMQINRASALTGNNTPSAKNGEHIVAIGEVCSREVVFVRADETVAAAAKLMRESHVGCLVVANEENGKRVPVGMLTDRDITVAVVAPGLDAEAILVGDVMSAELLSVQEDAGIAETVELMRVRGIRRLPVTDANGALIGLIAADDILSLLAEEIAGIAGMISREEKRERTTRKTRASG
jgi:CBS domain-containing protein